MTCTSCGKEQTEASPFCSRCGAQQPPNDATQVMTGHAPMSLSKLSQSRPRSSSDSFPGEGRFLPGTLVAERYRIIAMLGKGGMGEVYRADDLTLGQPVALKFLAEEVTESEDALVRFRNEVRIARKVSHPNVCRVYDVGEAEGHTFLSMEYVDGEDLGSLLRRIGRLPADKALEISRKLCAGLSAAHEQGVLHRDLKPANVMLDGRGQAVITDFGLAALAAEMNVSEVRSGTPAYMAPEQLSGKEVTVRSDLYALGLVLYEVFTGKRPFKSDTLANLVQSRNENPPTNPSSLVHDLDPLVERIILRCLERDPLNRPPSALAVAAALPGGDPLAAALAAGETPTPQMVAASGRAEGLAPRWALLCLVLALGGMGLTSFVDARFNGLNRMKPGHSPEVLAHDARSLLSQLGYGEHVADSAHGFFYDYDFLTYVKKTDKPKPNWDRVFADNPPLLRYWYRQSPIPLSPSDFTDNLLTPGIVTPSDPPLTVSGMVHLQMDPQGHLLYLEAIPPQKEELSKPAPPANWDALFSAAGLDRTKLQSVEPTWTSLGASDARAAWNGTWPGGAHPLHVEAAAFRGKPVFFSLIGSWTKPDRMGWASPGEDQKPMQFASLTLFFTLIGGSFFLGRRNYLAGKGDKTGALRLATFTFCAQILLWICRSHHTLSPSLLGNFIMAVSTGLFLSAILWLLYMALEPYVRRHWPHSIIAWNRLLAGHFRDPMVGRDVLFGVVLGVIWIVIFAVHTVIAQRAGAAPGLDSPSFLLDPRTALGAWLMHVPNSIQATLVFFFLLFLFRVLLRNKWLASAAFVFVFAGLKLLQTDNFALDLPPVVLVYGIAAFVAVRFGFVALAVGVFTADVLGALPIPADFSAWYAGNSMVVLLSLVILAIWAFYTSLGGQSLLNDELFD